MAIADYALISPSFALLLSVFRKVLQHSACVPMTAWPEERHAASDCRNGNATRSLTSGAFLAGRPNVHAEITVLAGKRVSISSAFCAASKYFECLRPHV